MTAITSKNIDLGECAIHFLESGEPEGMPVILLHGMKFQAQTWRELGTLALLAEVGAYVLAVDLPGFGQSPADQLAPVEVLHRLIDQLNLGPVVLIGPSMGGRVALEFGICYPQHLAGLVLVGAVGVEEHRSALADINAPTLIVWGSEDQISPLTNSDILLAGIAGAKREIFADAPHPCYLAQPDRWHACLRDFFTNLLQ
ncbi:MAG: alpha/beta fold hydrolase [Desulfobulbaceae bacterium]|jgi:abhydrolase domain-containing protein 14|nr:alpha/beta fold hydrolase [Desulfobulbaceae bacterium]